MRKLKTKERHNSHERGQKFVKEYHGLDYHPIYNTEVHIPGKFAEVDVTLNLGTHPIPDLTDVSNLDTLKSNMGGRVCINAAPSSTVDVEQKPKRKISLLGWAAIIIGGAAACYAGYQLCKKSA